MLGTLHILRTRWQEVLLIVGLQAAGGFAFMQAMKSGSGDSVAIENSLPFAVLSVSFLDCGKNARSRFCANKSY